MNRLLRNLLAVVLVVLTPTRGPAQDAPKGTSHPKLGLVLEGGGALGLAHIGVIRWLEEHRIPVSYIAGTSMGGLVGGIYATGRSASELHDLVQGIDWDEVLSGRVPFEDLSFRRKQDSREYPNTVEFGLRKGVQFPSGFNDGRQVDMILDRVSLPYDQVKTFDELPIPFACVAVDLTSNDKHVFRSGRLDLALRSTMSLPGIFSPVHSGNHIYVDGGLMDNLPIGVAKEMGADITLGIHLQADPLKPDTDLSSFAVLAQSISAVIAANERRSIEEADMIVVVPLPNFTPMDYNKGEAIIAAGYAAAEANASKLLSLSVDEATWKQYLAVRDARRQQAVTPQFVKVAGVSDEITTPIAGEMSVFANKPVDTTSLDTSLTELAGLGAFSNLSYSMVEKGGESGLEIHMANKPYSPPIVRPLILIDGSDFNDVFFTIGSRFIFPNFGGYRRELRSDVMLGSQYALDVEYYRPFTVRSNWFIAPRAGFDSYNYPLYDGNTLTALYRNRTALGGLDIGYVLKRSGELRVGYEGGYQKLSSQIGSKELPNASGATGDVRLQFILDKLDNPIVPRSGKGVDFFTKYFNVRPGAPNGFPVSELQLQNFFRVSNPSSVFLNAYGGTSYGHNAGVPMFQLGGVTRFSAYGTNSLLTNQYFLFQMGYVRELTKINPMLGSTVDVLFAIEGGKTYRLPSGAKPPSIPGDVLGAIVLNTLFGPVEIGGAYGNYGRGKIFFQVGRIF